MLAKTPVSRVNLNAILIDLQETPPNAKKKQFFPLNLGQTYQVQMEHPLKAHVIKKNSKESRLREIEEDKEECSVTDKKNSRIQTANLESGFNIKQALHA